MKSNALILLFSLFTFFTFAQDSDSEPKGEPHFKVFWNYNYDFSEDVTQTSAFELNRVYLGYKYKFNDNVSAKITYDVGKNDAGSNYTAFVKIAQLDYKLSSKVKLSMGMIGGKQFNDQEKVWGYQSKLDTHTVETHIHRLRKKIKEKFFDDNLIISKKNGYEITEKK